MGEADAYYAPAPAGPGPVNQQPYPQPPPQQQQHGQPYQNHAPQAPPPPYDPEKHSFDQTFKVERPRYNDLWAGILFLLVVAGFTVVSALALHSYAGSRGPAGAGTGIHNGHSFTLSSNAIVLFALVLAVAFVLGYGYVMVARAFPRQFIWVTCALNVAFAIGSALYMLYRRYYAGGIVFLVFAVLTAVFYWTARRRIPFSALMLRTAVNVAKGYGHVFLASLLAGLVAIGLAAWFSVTLVAVYVRWQPDAQGRCVGGGAGCSRAKVTGLVVFITFAMYWMSEWLKNTLHTTVCGVYGSWYYSPRTFPRDATRAALRRSLTYSFGSISLGSLIVAIINLLRNLCSAAQQQDAGSGDWIGCAVWCVANCLLGILEWVVEFINRYAFVQVALYGKPYIASAKDTWRMIKDRGMDALINDCLVGPVLSFGGIFVAYACALLAYLYVIFTKPEYNSDGGYTVLIVAFAFVIGLQVANIFTTPISSGVDTIFVAAAWNPEVMMRDHRELYEEMITVYPHVQTAIHA